MTVGDQTVLINFFVFEPGKIYSESITVTFEFIEDVDDFILGKALREVYLKIKKRIENEQQNNSQE